ncbi:uncharacterized protein LOC130641068 [Hydractinia symbiolongicarpus]|uniref:uncharacterized protein LOC130641068 n=1 Tax=Hydractinia symbiolongicarpus TaxID=13093 RepID=UPI00254DF4A2|nr:uncharacterized protein LOC130641068 [Hydractinia symbiolongicarpus]
MLQIVILAYASIRFVLDGFFVFLSPTWLKYDLTNHPGFQDETLLYGVFKHCLSITLRDCIATEKHVDIHQDHALVKILVIGEMTLKGVIVVFQVFSMKRSFGKNGMFVVSVLSIVNGIFGLALTGRFISKRQQWLEDAKSDVMYAPYYYIGSAVTTILLSLGMLLYGVKWDTDSNNNNQAVVEMIQLYPIREEGEVISSENDVNI